jgi:hypothetical protein
VDRDIRAELRRGGSVDEPERDASTDGRIVEIARGHITMQVGGRRVTIQCEGYSRDSRALNSPDFDVYADSIKQWDAPDDNVGIDGPTRDRILDMLRDAMRSRGLQIEIQ